MEEEEGQEEALTKDLAPALLALHPRNAYVVVAVGTELRIFNLDAKHAIAIKDGSGHDDAIKAIRFDREGKLFVSAGDDKLVKLWDTKSWLCIKTVRANKKVSAATFNNDSRWLVYADKFGVVYVASTSMDENDVESTVDQSAQLLAHCCSIITSLDCSADGRFIITADRDFKIRVSIFPRNPLKGAHEIQSFCLGHTSFVSCISFVGELDAMQFLVSGGGDGTVRLWELESARLLDTFLAAEATLVSEDHDHVRLQEQPLSITCIATSKDGSVVAVGVESLDGILLLKCDLKSKQLTLLQKVVVSKHFCPTSIHFDQTGCLWMVAGAAQKLDIEGQKASAWMNVASIALLSPSEDFQEFKLIEEESLQGGTQLLETIEGNQSDLDKALTLADAANVAMKKHLLKREYTQEHREFRKRMRNDKKLQV